MVAISARFKLKLSISASVKSPSLWPAQVGKGLTNTPQAENDCSFVSSNTSLVVHEEASGRCYNNQAFIAFWPQRPSLYLLSWCEGKLFFQISLTWQITPSVAKSSTDKHQDSSIFLLSCLDFNHPTRLGLCAWRPRGVMCMGLPAGCRATAWPGRQLPSRVRLTIFASILQTYLFQT